MVQPLLREVYGRLLRRMRQQQGRTLAEVAAEAGISMAYLSEIERGLKEPSSEILAAVCGALDATIVGLVGAAHVELRDLTDAVSREGACSTSPRAGAPTRVPWMVPALRPRAPPPGPEARCSSPPDAAAMVVPRRGGKTC